MRLRCGSSRRRFRAGATSIVGPMVVAAVLLVGAGVAYRVLASTWRMSADTHIDLPVPLAKFPKNIGPWIGEDLEIPAVTQTYMKTHFADDYVSRRYVNRSDGWLSADVYIVYCSTRLSGIIGHKPRVCYPNNGWVWDSTVESSFTARSGKTIQCLLHCFHRPPPAYQQIYVLNFYVWNGEITLSEKPFSRLADRRLNLSGNPGRYVAQVQISSVTEHTAMTLASQLTDLVLNYLPDQSGRVGAAEDVTASTQAGGAAESDK